MAATPAQRPSMWSKMLNAAVMPTIQKNVSVKDRKLYHGSGKGQGNSPCMPLTMRITAARGMAPSNFTWWCKRPRSSSRPTRTSSVAPATMPIIWPRALPWREIRKASTAAAYSASPPSKGIGLTWILREPGMSSMPVRNARCRASGVRPNEVMKASANARTSFRTAPPRIRFAKAAF